ncbi:AMP-binding protein [Streptomyces sp. NPDC005925]|uniref:AMP-binding protein n=1 Tax=Streptomyces sp. NPDC005925 TaxID=3157172 RepID=UPI0033DCB149
MTGTTAAAERKPVDRSLGELLERNVRVTGERLALSDAHRSWTYAALGALVGHLVEEFKDLGIAPGEPVAVAGPRDARLLALLYGVLGCGNPVVAVSPDWSDSDRARRLRTVGVRVVLTTEAGAVTADGGETGGGGGRVVVVDVDAVLDGAADTGSWGRQPDPDDVVYYSFTSGSSGEPKAVAVAQRNAAHYASSLARRLGLGADGGADGGARPDATREAVRDTGRDTGPGVGEPPVLAHLTTLAADLGHTSWMLALATGGRVHVVGDRVTRDPYALWRELAEHRVTGLKTTPSHLAALLPGRDADTPALDTLIIGGELLSREFAAGLFAGGVARRVVNHYGPTEATVGAACFVASSPSDLPPDEPSVPIGTPIGANTLTLDGTGESAEGTGELVVGGPGVALGYAGTRPDAGGRFRTTDAGPVYRTGDRCRRRSDGTLVFLGRADRQTKVNGYRVDLAEIEQVLARCPGVEQAAVLGRTVDGRTRLVAAVRTTADAVLADLPGHLARTLPRYAVPAPIVPLADFPVDANGKRDHRALHSAVDQWLASGPGGGHGGHGGPADSTGLVGELAEFWGASLGIGTLGADADVIALGADSILAMRTVVFLRERGHEVVVTDVYDHPTAARLAGVAAGRRAAGPSPVCSGAAESAAAGRRGTLGPAQRWFFDAVPGGSAHWNQAMLLACEPALDLPALSTALTAVLERHEALRAGVTPTGALGTTYPASGTLAVTWSPAGPAPSAEETIARTSAELNRSLDPASGRLLRCHVFRGGPTAPDRLLLVCHHLVVDTISWRILLDDLIRAYETAAGGARPALPPARSYYDWAAAAGEPGPRAPRPRDGRHGATYSWAADAEVTRALVAEFGTGLRMEALAVAAMTRALQDAGGARRTRVTVETHGRDGEHAYLDTVGWFTAVKQLVLGYRPDVADVERLVAGTGARRLDEADGVPDGTPGGLPHVAVNYLGQFRAPSGRSVSWTFAPEYCGPARAVRHDPLYPLVLTARLVGGRLVADLVCDEEQRASGTARRAFARFTEEILAAAGTTGTVPSIEEPAHTTSGLPVHTGTAKAPVPAGARALVTQTPRVLLTGATGFLGAHLLDHLVAQGAEVTCLVRRAGGRGAAERLAASDRVRVVEGDLADASAVRALASGGVLDGLTAVVNAAADVRLVAPPEELARVNVGGLRNLLDLIRATRPETPLHHVSTLAVAGYHDSGPRRFSEADFALGQRFLSPYEASKFEAEKVLREASDLGTRVYVYRTNHVAAHSRTGAFQTNIGDNRVYQTLRGYILAGCAPRSPHTAFGFSHVDTVAAGICRLALAADVPPDVYHVETPHTVAHDELVGWIREFGHPVRLVERGEFVRALGRLEHADARSADMSRAWEHRPDRNVAFDHTRTVALLRRLGVEFAPPRQAWLDTALAWASGTGFFPAPAPAPAPAPSWAPVPDPARAQAQTAARTLAPARAASGAGAP